MAKSKTSGLDWLDRSLLTSPYCYALCLSEKAFRVELKRLGVPKRRWPEFLQTSHAGGTAHFIEKTSSSDFCTIVTMHPSKDRELEQVYGMLVHEAVHIWQAVKENIGESRPGSESEAYAIQSIAQSLMFSYKEQTAKKPARKK